MEIIGIQIVVMSFSVFMIYFTYHSYRRGFFEVYSLVAWLTIFVVLIISTLFPSIFMPFLSILRVARLFDFFMIIGIFFLLALAYVNFIQIEKLKHKIDKLVQDKAIKEDKKD